MSTEMIMITALVDLCNSKDVIMEINQYGLKLIKFKNNRMLNRQFSKELLASYNSQVQLETLINMFNEEFEHSIKEDN